MTIEFGKKEVTYEDAKLFLGGLIGKWVYIRNVNDISGEASQQAGIYSKIRISNFIINDDELLIYGKDDQDRCFISGEDIISWQLDEYELLVVLENNHVYSRLYIRRYAPNMHNRYEDILYTNKNIVICEGKTDWMHMKRALKRFRLDGKYSDIDFAFFETEETIGIDKLKKICDYNSIFESNYFKIFVYDADNIEINKMHEGKKFVYHGNNVYSIVLPVPSFRNESPDISIENYYSDDEITTSDIHGRRLFLKKEFNQEGYLRNSPNIKDINFRKHSLHGSSYIIDDKVMKYENVNGIDTSSDNYEINIALPKSKFAKYIYDEVPPFDKFGYQNFKLVFDVIREILSLERKGQFVVKQDGILNRIEVQKGIYVCEYNTGVLIMEIHSDIPVFLSDKGKSSTFALDMHYKEGCFVIDVLYDCGTVSIFLDSNNSIVTFLEEKVKSSSNRMELYYTDKDFIRGVELFKDDIYSVVIERELDKYYQDIQTKK